MSGDFAAFVTFLKEVRQRGNPENSGLNGDTDEPARAVRPQPKWNRESAIGAKIDTKKTQIGECLDLLLSDPRSSAQSAVNFGRPIVTTADYADERGSDDVFLRARRAFAVCLPHSAS
jgi:hypothetical protein